jgi:hypothetical protein
MSKFGGSSQRENDNGGTTKPSRSDLVQHFRSATLAVCLRWQPSFSHGDGGGPQPSGSKA